MTRRPLRIAVPMMLAVGALAAGCGSDDTKTVKVQGLPDGSTVAVEQGGKTAKATTIDGEGYTFTAPEGFEKASADAGAAGAATMLTHDAQNISVVVAPSAGSLTTDMIADGLRQTMAAQQAKSMKKLELPALDGEKAAGFAYSVDQSGVSMEGQVAAVVHDGKMYTVTLTGAKDGIADGRKALQTVVDSWKWAA